MARAFSFPWSQLIAAGATFNPLADWQYETPEGNGVIQVYERATAIGLVSAVTAAGENIKQEGPVQAGGTAGTLPAFNSTTPWEGTVRKGQKLRCAYRNPTGGGITVDGQIILTMKGGR